jgi:hypothetical protein
LLSFFFVGREEEKGRLAGVERGFKIRKEKKRREEKRGREREQGDGEFTLDFPHPLSPMQTIFAM